MKEASTDSPPVAIVIEDDEQMALLLRVILQKEGYVVKTAHDGRAARAIMEEQPPPAVVTLDFMLPDANGLELLAIMRARSDWKDVPVVMLTSKSREGDVARALEAGASGYLAKPFKPEELRACVRRVVRGPGA